MQTSSGRLIDLINPDPADILITDIATHLAMLCRFNGATRGFYSVAQHSVLVARMVPQEARMYALLHDAHEAYIGDMTSPVKRALSGLGGKVAIKRLTENLDMAICMAFGLKFPVPNEIARVVGHADLVALATEKRDLLAEATWSTPPLPSPAKNVIKPMQWPKAMEAFISEFNKLLPAFPATVRAQENFVYQRETKRQSPNLQTVKGL